MLKLLQIWSISFAFHKSLLDLLLFWYILSVFLINHFLNNDGLGLWNQVFWVDHKLNKDYLAKMKKNNCSIRTQGQFKNTKTQLMKTSISKLPKFSSQSAFPFTEYRLSLLQKKKWNSYYQTRFSPNITKSF